MKFKLVISAAILAASVAGPSMAQQAAADFSQRIFRSDRPAVTGTVTYEPSQAGYVRMAANRVNQTSTTAICTRQVRDANVQGFAQSLGDVASRAWRSFLGSNSNTGTAVRVFVGATAETDPAANAISDILFNQVTVPKKLQDCRPEAFNGVATSPLANLSSGTPTFVARVRRWYTNDVSDASMSRIATVAASAGSIAGIPVPIATQVASVGSRIYQTEQEADMASTVGEVFNPFTPEGGQTLRVFTGYTQPTGPNPNPRRGRPAIVPRPFVPADTDQPYVDIYLETVASIFDQRSATFDQAKAAGRVQMAADSANILDYPIANTRPAMDSLRELFAPNPDLIKAITDYQLSPTLDLLEERCSQLSERLMRTEVGLSRQDVHLVLFALAQRHSNYGVNGPDDTKRGLSLSRPCMVAVKGEIERLGVAYPDIEPPVVAVSSPDRAAVADSINAAATATSPSAAFNVLRGNLAPEVVVFNGQALMTGVNEEQSYEAQAFATLLRSRFSAAGCSLPTDHDTANAPKIPVSPVMAGELMRTMVTVLVSENGQDRYAGIFQFTPRRPGTAPTVAGVVIQTLTEPMMARIRDAYPGGCELLPAAAPAATPSPELNKETPSNGPHG